MVPAIFVTLERLPLTPNGKIDRRALPAVTAARGDDAPARRGAPRTADEQMVAAVWSELLGVARIDVLDDFLDLGGHSLLVMRAVAMLEARTGKRLTPRAFIFQSLEQIARDYEQLASAPPPAVAVKPAPAPPATTDAPARGLLGRVRGYFGGTPSRTK